MESTLARTWDRGPRWLSVSSRRTARRWGACGRGGAALGIALLAAGCTKQEPAGKQTTPADAESEGRAPTTAATSAAAHRTADAQAAFAERQTRRDRMVDETIVARGVTDVRVVTAMRKVPRHRFVPPAQRDLAYEDRPLPIGDGQTISQPYIVAFMTQAARPSPNDRCLEIGTGSGYQAAVLAEVCADVFSIEYLPSVAARGERALRSLGYGPDRVHLRVGDGYRGWPEQAPFEVILVTAAPESVPPPLLEQLAVGGRLVIPVGRQSGAQGLERWTRRQPGSKREAFKVDELMQVSFVPFLGEAAAR